MKVLILSCDTGEGHNSAGKAINERFHEMGIECDMADTMAIAGKNVSKVVSDSYLKATSSSGNAFGFIYSVGKTVSNVNESIGAKSPVYAANALYRNRLASYISDGGYDVAVTPHLFPAECLTSLNRSKNFNFPFVSIATDYTCIPFWTEIEPTYCTIPHSSLLEQFSKMKLSEEQFLPFGIPVSGRFNKKIPKDEACQALGLDPNLPTLLIMSGSMGYGNIEELIKALLDKFGADAQMLVLCGNNDKMREQLAEKFSEAAHIAFLPFTDKVSLLMDAADIVFTKPGGLTSTEVAVKNVPLAHTAPIPGCESLNIKFFEKNNLSINGGQDNSPAVLAEAAYKLCGDADAKARMLAAQRSVINPFAAENICDFMLEKFG